MRPRHLHWHRQVGQSLEAQPAVMKMKRPAAGIDVIALHLVSIRMKEDTSGMYIRLSTARST